MSLDKLSYALGISLGNNLKNSGFTGLNYAEIARGIEEIDKANDLSMTLQEAQELINMHYQEAQVKVNEKNIEEGVKFLLKNAQREGVITTDSGLQYEVITEGKGVVPSASDTVKVHYHGTLLNGKVFDSSVDRGEPATFGVTQVIHGWVEALQLMPVGSKWKLYIPSDLAYGVRGAGESIAPHTTLVFEVELLDIV